MRSTNSVGLLHKTVGHAMDAERKRRVHRKSRRGCRNCKLRRVKCDEARPGCLKCADYGVSCNYADTKTPDLQMSFKGFAQPVLGLVKLPRTLPTPPPIILDSFQPSNFQLDRQMLDRLGRFQTRTVLSMGNGEMGRLYQKEAVELAFHAPYLMHIVQTITAIHDRYLCGAPMSGAFIEDIYYHWSQGISLFNRKLSSPIQDKDRDALWSAAALSGIVAIASIEATKPEDAWPLKPPEDSDLDWLRMSEGKVAVWQLTNPARHDSIFHSIFKTYFAEKKENGLGSTESVSPGVGVGAGGPLIGPWLEHLPWQFIHLYGLDDDLNNNPYYPLLHRLGILMPKECCQQTLVTFLGFLSHSSTAFKTLLDVKDHRALLLMAYWHAKTCNTSVWWMDRRATVECQAICLYLEKYSNDTTLHELLEFPRSKCGLKNILNWDSPKGCLVDGVGGMQNYFSVIESH